MSTRTLYEGRWLTLVDRDGWEYVSRRRCTGIVGIIAITDDRKLLLVSQHRTALQKQVIELPAGIAGDIPGGETEDLATAARRELLEETGYDCQRMIELADGTSSSGLCDEIITLFRAEGLSRISAGGGDSSERITVHEVPLTDLRPWLSARRADGFLIDLKVYVATGLMA